MSDVRLANVKEDIRRQVGTDGLAADVAAALEGLFEINSFKRFRAYSGNFVGMYAKATKNLRSSLAIDREVFVLLANYTNVHARTIVICQEQIASEQPRLEPTLVVVVHADPDGDQNLRNWGREAGLTVLPIYKPTGGAMPSTWQLRQSLARELFTADSFQVTGPVSDDSEFFGRREQALGLLRRLQAGQIAALFGLRKVGKTSMLNRVIELSRAAGSPRVAMVDCSIRAFNQLSAEGALRALARVSRLSCEHGYAHISQTLRRGDEGLLGTFDSIWEKFPGQTLLIVLDEVDYITPESPTNTMWRSEFLEFWRELRALVQEAKRHNFQLSLLVTGASSKSFRVAEVDGVENPVLHFVPEDYLSPFESGASEAMIRALGNRCGLNFTSEAREHLSRVAAGLPYWIRMAGSYIHRHIDIDDRPAEVNLETTRTLCQEFAETEGAEIARVALQSLRRVDAPMFEMLLSVKQTGSAPLNKARPLLRYGLVRQRGSEVFIASEVVDLGLDLLLSQSKHPGVDEAGELTASSQTLWLNETEWAEELATISRRRNLLERKTREFIRVVLRMTLPKEKSWVDGVMESLPTYRREVCKHLAPDSLMGQLYWQELGLVIAREWSAFERFFENKKRLQAAFELLNERPDAHAKEVDLADIALQRRELDWLEKRITQ